MSPRPSVRSDLPPLPDVELIVEHDERMPDGYLHLRRTRMRARFPDGTVSEPFRYDSAERERLDAVVVAPHFRDASGRRCVLLRSALRPPAALRPREVWPIPEKPTLGELWEVPAGLVEPDERTEEGLRRCAARELFEETGAKLDVARVEPLGPSTFPSPGVIGERHFYFHAEIDPDSLVEPPEDGSVLERQAAIVALPLEVALELVRNGEIEDAKTEIALRRLAEL
jgi:ADP-ribose pyrophosphatase